MKKTKVLYFVDRMRHGGIQQLAVAMAQNMPKDIQLDFLVLNDGETYPLEDTIKNMGLQLYKVNAWVYKPQDYVKYYKELDRFFKEHNDYRVIHINTSSKNFMILKLAKKYGIPVRIAHSHNTGFQTQSKAQILVGNTFKPLLKKYATNYFACSKTAGEWLFGKESVKKGNVKIIPNAIDQRKFEYNSDKRIELRKELNIENKLVIGHVGRFTTQKNHTFLIDIFYEIHQKRSDSCLLLVGIGDKEDEIKKKVQELGIQNDVIFMGHREDVNALMQAMDAFVLPSLYEGFPVVCVEAQAIGIPCFISKDVISDEVKIAPNVKFISLNESAKIWSDEILSSNLERLDNEILLKEKGFYMKDMTNAIADLYRNI